jgi:hypothetical protein
MDKEIVLNRTRRILVVPKSTGVILGGILRMNSKQARELANELLVAADKIESERERRMARQFYTRTDLEEDLMMLESMRAALNRGLLEKKISGFKFNKLRNQLDEEERQARMKLVGTVLRLEEENQLARDTVAISSENGRLYRKSAGKWVETSEAELRGLEGNGAKFRIHKPKQYVENGEVRTMRLPIDPAGRNFTLWKRVPREEARKAAAAGKNVRWGENKDYADVES